MQNKPARLFGFSSAVLFAVAWACLGPAWAQEQDQDAATLPDYAGALGAPLVERDARSGEMRPLDGAEIDARARKVNPKRGEKQRAQAAGVNRAIHAMPATAADARRQAKQVNGRGTTIFTSREEITPIYGVRGANGRLVITHSTGATPSDSAR
ncbi:hypothetical protein [Luteimonas panaciterrae]|uniref:hypothetical protein n=1 Tax=Luteimonas panaciterrae TaxID=363885 RepID=UPI001CFC0E7F|nr:hypothetical protein [Luteimonas panaciterrae]